MRSFTFNGVTYSDAPAGWLKCARDEWDGKLRRTGHSMTWRKDGRDAYSGNCRRCGGNVTCGSSWSTSSGLDIRHRRCGKAGFLQLIIGGRP